VFGDHLAYAAVAAPQVSFSLIVSKLAAGAAGLLLAMLLAPKLLK
jgi:ethanolamine transporter EutH